MDYSVELKPEALVELDRLTPAMPERIIKKIAWLAEHFEQVSPQPLTGDLSSLFKLRVGDYRVIYTFNRQLKTIVVHQIGHRSEIYG